MDCLTGTRRTGPGRIQDSRFKIQDCRWADSGLTRRRGGRGEGRVTGHWSVVTGHWSGTPSPRALEFRRQPFIVGSAWGEFKIRDSRFKIAAGRILISRGGAEKDGSLVTGHLSLVTGHWSVVIGHWSGTPEPRALEFRRQPFIVGSVGGGKCRFRDADDALTGTLRTDRACGGRPVRSGAVRRFGK